MSTILQIRKGSPQVEESPSSKIFLLVQQSSAIIDVVSTDPQEVIIG
jgi:hypothetical protein